jgi:type IV pilus assembly protein PilB
MNPFAQFVGLLRSLLPEQRKLVDSLAELHADDPARIIKELADRAVIGHARACQLWADALGVAYVNPFNVELPNDAANQLSLEVARRAQAIVLNTLADTATVAMADPTNRQLVGSLGKVLGRTVSPVYAHPAEISAIIELHFGAEETLAGSLQAVCNNWASLEGGREIRTVQDVTDMVNSQAFSDLFNSIIVTAFRRKASDIHFEAAADECRVRMRIDGDMTKIISLPRVVHDSMIVRIKVLSHLDVAQNRLPQDGAFEISFAGRRPAFRASTMPGLYGEKGVLRLLGTLAEQSIPRLGTLGLADSTRHALRRAILRPNGILLVCGPTGCGKTTTLYACLNEINRPDLNIVTIEDPVEYRLPGINQHQVNHQIDLKFSDILRGILRQDPDVMLVGEIRDVETARIATEAALTGHLVMSSLHTNNSVQAITRLVELGVEPHMVAPTVVGVLSQRLVRRICSSCKESYTAAPDDLASYFHNPAAEPVTLYRGRGCPHCYGTGYSGRLGVHEMLEVTEGMRDLINHGAGAIDLQEEAKRFGFRSMRYDGLKKVLLGWTTLEEVERNTLPELAREPATI